MTAPPRPAPDRIGAGRFRSDLGRTEAEPEMETTTVTDETYNGWPNWDTWNVSLWINNEEPWYRDKIRYLRRTATVTGSGVESFVREIFDGVTSFDGTVTNSTPDGADLGRVDWDYLADHWSEESAELER